MQTAVHDMTPVVAPRQSFVARRRTLGSLRFDAIEPDQLRSVLAARIEAREPTRIASSSLHAQWAGRAWLEPLLAQQELVLPEGSLLTRFLGNECARGQRAASFALSLARAQGRRVVCIGADARVVPWGLQLRRLHRGLNLVGAFDAGSDLRDPRGLQRMATRIQASGAEVVLLRVPHAGMAALAALPHAALGAPLILSFIEPARAR